MPTALEALQAQSQLLNGQMPLLLAACQTSAQMNAVSFQCAAAKANYVKAVNGIFAEDDPAVQKLVAQINSAQNSLAKAIANLADITNVINVITSAVKVGASLVAKL